MHLVPDGVGGLFAAAHVQGHVDGVVVDELGRLQNACLGGGVGGPVAVEVLTQELEELGVGLVFVRGVGHFWIHGGGGGVDGMGERNECKKVRE